MPVAVRISLLTIAFLASGGVSLVFLVMLMAMGANASAGQELLLKRLMLSVVGTWGLSLPIAVWLLLRGAWTPAIVAAAFPVVFCAVLLIVGLATGA